MYARNNFLTKVELNGFKVFVIHGILITKKIATFPESNSIDVLLIMTKPFVDDSLSPTVDTHRGKDVNM
ncbi:hypothetical protein [[Scytonema hofmanni] UTEX B 1581]|uniref:hypothetical protein n=1 Tax=[Scytonema hofmanni] UTEX B 1581 TaxID=379535 RepID=UPI000496E86A|nr:hypothetical protein [[Scytonema hofmanni] UTEX B 1581]